MTYSTILVASILLHFAGYKRGHHYSQVIPLTVIYECPLCHYNIGDSILAGARAAIRELPSLIVNAGLAERGRFFLGKELTRREIELSFRR